MRLVSLAAAVLVGAPLLVGAAAVPDDADVAVVAAALASVPSEYGIDQGTVETLDQEVLAGEPVYLIGAEAEIGISVLSVNQGDTIDEVTAGRSAVFHDDDTSTLAQRKEDGSIQILTTIESPSAPREYGFELTLPTGANTVINEDGSVAILGSDGSFLGGVQAPWAFDAAGNAVATHYQIDGTRLTQVVDHGEGSAYPIVADPWLGAELYGKVSITNTSQGFVVTTRPSNWGAAFQGTTNIGMWWAHADEVKNKMPNPSKWSLSLQEQLYCHIAGFPISANPNYDLESWKPYVRWEQQALTKCQSY